MLGDDVLLSFSHSTDTCKIMGKTTMITVTYLEEYRVLCCWPLFRLFRTATMSSYMVTRSVHTHHIQHTMHD